ncbi:MAG: phosphoadenylyl-sulfate reductase [Pseudomonadota bacterium]
MPLIDRARQSNLVHAHSTPQEILRQVLTDQRFGPTALVSAFGADSVALLHMVAEIDRSTPVIFVDTEMLFAETLDYQRSVADHLGLTDVRVISPNRGALLVQDVDGLLHQADVDACCDLRRTAPMTTALQGFETWISGRRQFRNGRSAAVPFFEKEDNAYRIRVNPLAQWTAGQVSDYIDTHDLPRHPLSEKGFQNLGCAPCSHRFGVGQTGSIQPAQLAR